MPESSPFLEFCFEGLFSSIPRLFLVHEVFRCCRKSIAYRNGPLVWAEIRRSTDGASATGRGLPTALRVRNKKCPHLHLFLLIRPNFRSGFECGGIFRMTDKFALEQYVTSPIDKATHTVRYSLRKLEPPSYSSYARYDSAAER